MYDNPLRRIRSIGMVSSHKAAFITGANKGIGYETARGLGELGIAVVLGCRDEGRGRESADRLRSAGIKEVEAIRFDVNRSEDHQAIFHHLDKQLRQARHSGQQRRHLARKCQLRRPGRIEHDHRRHT